MMDRRRQTRLDPDTRNWTQSLLIALGLALALGAVAWGVAKAGTRVDVQHPNWRLVCTLDAAAYTCAGSNDCALTVHCHGGTLFTNGFEP